MRDVKIATEELEWTEGVIIQHHLHGRDHTYDVRFARAPNNETYCRPVKPYEVHEFEEMFGFGSHCTGFSTDRVILIRNRDVFNE